MCVLVIAIDVHPEHHVLVAANRDENRARPTVAPAVHTWGARQVLAPRDVQAGGTWEGVNDAGLVVVITNRRDGDHDPKRASRGALCRAALEHASAEAVREWIQAATRDERYNSFNLFYADAGVSGSGTASNAGAAFVSSWNGELHTRALDAGVHVLSNLHTLGELRLPEAEVLAAPDAPPKPERTLHEQLVRVLASHEPRDAHGFQICKHGSPYGTVSSSLLYVTHDGDGIVEYAPGTPCSTTFDTYRLASSA